MNQTDFIPRPDAKFDVFFKNIADIVVAESDSWGHIPPDEVTKLINLYNEWSEAFKETQKPHIPQITTEKNRIRFMTERSLRAYINRYLRWPPVTDIQRDKMGIRNWAKVRNSQPEPITVPEMEANSSVIRVLKIRVRDHNSSHWRKPAYVRSMELAWGISECCPKHISDLHNLEIATSNPFVLTFEEEERGKKVYYASRWLNNKAQAGPWSDIESAFVP